MSKLTGHLRHGAAVMDYAAPVFFAEILYLPGRRVQRPGFLRTLSFFRCLPALHLYLFLLRSPPEFSHLTLCMMDIKPKRQADGYFSVSLPFTLCLVSLSLLNTLIKRESSYGMLLFHYYNSASRFSAAIIKRQAPPGAPCKQNFFESIPCASSSGPPAKAPLFHWAASPPSPDPTACEGYPPTPFPAASRTGSGRRPSPPDPLSKSIGPPG